MVYIFREQNCYGFFPFFYKTSLKILEKCTENGLIKKLHPWHWQHSAQLGTIISEIGNCLCILMNSFFFTKLVNNSNNAEEALEM